MLYLVNDKLRLIQNLLVNVAGDIVFHYRRPASMKRFITWQEDAEDNQFSANNRSQEICLTGTIDLFTPGEYDQLVDDITSAFVQATRAKAMLTMVDYEDETNLIHHQWTFWVV